jgi:hypothetical protein
MKSELIQKLEELLQTEDITSIKQQVRDLLNDFKAETAKESQLQREQFEASEQEEGADFHYQAGPEDERFYELYGQYKDRVKEHGKKIAEEQKQNFERKKELLNKLEDIIQNEENIKTAFDGFHAIRDEYAQLGEVPGDKYRDLEDRYLGLKDQFFYNINIYKELRENDLKKNEELKQELIVKVKALKGLESIKEKDQMVRLYQKEWSDIGPSSRETYKEMADEFFGTCREIIEEIKSHYDSLKEEQEANLEKKKALVKNMQELLSHEIKNHGTWKKKTDEVLAMQKEWKSIGFAPKKENEEVWQEFRGLCDLFFDKKGAYYEKRREEQSGNSDAKKQLIEKAREIQDSTDWKSSTETFLKLQKDWKKVGPALPKEEQKLWQQFRAACDKFFEAKKSHFAGMGERQEKNLEEKLALIKEIEEFKLSGEKSADIASLKDFSNRFNEIGYVPKPKIQEVFDKYHAALDQHYNAIDMDREERKIIQYKSRVEDLKGDDSGRAVQREKRLLRDKIDRLNERVLQYEANMEIFTGSGAEALKKDIQKKIDISRREISEIKKKLSLLRD